jgi:hypothetical protein
MTLGCTIQSDPQTLVSFVKLQSKYGVKEAFSSNLFTMNDYISELSALKTQSSIGLAKTITAEIYSAQAFYYLNKTLSESSQINYTSIKCSSKEVMSILSSVTLAKDNAENAITALGGLSDSEKKNLRVNQLDDVKNYAEQINQIYSFFSDKCGLV